MGVVLVRVLKEEGPPEGTSTKNRKEGGKEGGREGRTHLSDDVLDEVDGLEGGLLHARHVRVQRLQLLPHQPDR